MILRIYYIFKILFSKINLKILFSTLSFLFLGYSISINLSKLLELSLDSSVFMLMIFSTLLTSLSLIANALAWKLLLEANAGKNIRINLLALFLKTNIFKYIPGGIWHFVERIRILKADLPFSRLILIIAIEPFLMILSASIWIPMGDLPLYIKFFSILPFCIIYPPIRKGIFFYLQRNVYNKLRKIDDMEDTFLNIDIHNSYLFKIPFRPFIVEMVFILLRFLGFWLCLKAFSIAPDLGFLNWLSIFSLAWIIGLVVPGAPGGIGVFESIILLITTKQELGASLISSLLCYRVVSTISDVLTYSLIRVNNRFNELFKLVR